MNPQQYSNMMRQHQESKEGGSPVTEVRDGEITRKYFDARRYDRFGAPNMKQVGRTANGSPVNNQPIVDGEDPLRLYLHKSRGRGETEPDMFEVQKRLFQLPRYDANFYPLHDILSNTHWSKQNQTRVLRMVTQYSIDIDRPSQGIAVQTPLEKAFETNNAEAAMLFVARGADINKLNANGFSAIHHAAINGMPELVANLAKRGAIAAKTASGNSVADLALHHFKTQLSLPPGLVTQDHFENGLNTYYKSVAAVRLFKLHSGPWDFKDHKQALNELTKSFPQYRRFIDTMELELDTIEPVKDAVTYPPSRAYTNIGGGLNDPVLDNFEHGWLGILSFLDSARENMQRSTILQSSLNKVMTCLRNMDQLTDPAAIAFLKKHRATLDLDIVAKDPKLNPHGDTLLTKAIREKKYDVARELMQLNVNFHATDAQGNTALHLLARTCTSKEQFLTTMKQLVGTPQPQPSGQHGKPSETTRASLLTHSNLADWYIPDAEGKTFMDVLKETHPEWAANADGVYSKDSWIPDIQEQLGIPDINQDIPPWSVERILRLGGPEEVLRIGKNPDLLLLTDRTLPELGPLSGYATRDERSEHVTQLVHAVTRLQNLKQDADPEEKKEITARLTSIVESQDPETKMRALLLFTDNMSTLNAGEMEGQVAIMRSIAYDMKNGDAQTKERVFTPFHEKTIEVQSNVVNFFQAQSFLQGVPEDGTEEEKKRMLAAVEDFRDASEMFTKSMSTYAQQKWGIVPEEYGNDESNRDTGQKPTGA